MMKRVEVDIIGDVKEKIYQTLLSYSRPGLKDADLRLRADDTVYAVALNANPIDAGQDYDVRIGVRVIAEQGGLKAPGYFGMKLGVNNFEGTESINTAVRFALDSAYERAYANAGGKLRAKQLLGKFGENLYSMELAPVEIHQDVVPASFEIDPRSVKLDDALGMALNLSEKIKGMNKIIKNQIVLQTYLARELFCSTEGAFIDESRAFTEGMVLVTGRKGPGEQPEVHWDCLGGVKGWEVLLDKNKNTYGQTFEEFALQLADQTARLSCAPFFVAPDDKKYIVVTNPHFNILLCHEIVGHPTEADRILKMEMGYAGRSWLFRGFDDNMIGEQVASKLLNVYSESSSEGYGNFKYDAEGVLSQRVDHIRNGTLVGFNNSRATAYILGHRPNGSMRAAQGSDVPIVRMRNTGIEAGTTDPKDIISGVEFGYYLRDHTIPSISESRENFRIGAREIWVIKDGQVTDGPYRGGGITSDSRTYLMNIEAVGNDLSIRNVPNCGKGEPVQVMHVGHFAPTIITRTEVAGVTE
jgi:TldD protein